MISKMDLTEWLEKFDDDVDLLIDVDDMSLTVCDDDGNPTDIKLCIGGRQIIPDEVLFDTVDAEC